jgi:hypothetical protein
MSLSNGLFGGMIWNKQRTGGIGLWGRGNSIVVERCLNRFLKNQASLAKKKIQSAIAGIAGKRWFL